MLNIENIFLKSEFWFNMYLQKKKKYFDIWSVTVFDLSEQVSTFFNPRVQL